MPTDEQWAEQREREKRLRTFQEQERDRQRKAWSQFIADWKQSSTDCPYTPNPDYQGDEGR